MTLTGIESGIGLARLLPPDQGAPESLADYRAAGGYDAAVWERAPAELLAAIEASGLRGRGGSAFPTGRKWRAVAARSGRKVVLLNAAESEPASRKDRTLLLLRPHLVIEGALLAARAVGARELVVYLHDDDPAPRAALEDAFAGLRRARFALPRWRIVSAPPGYVAGEESAAIRRVNGGPAKPSAKPPLPFERGVRGRATLVNNVETLANVPLIARHGPAWFRAAGSPGLPGTLLVTLAGAVRCPGVYEVAGGAPLGAVIGELGGEVSAGAGIQAVLPGGYFSGWLPGAAVAAAALEPDALAGLGVALGSGAIVVVPDTVCGLAQAARLLRFFADESARQCGPCTHGTQAMAGVFTRLLAGTARPEELERLRLWSERMLPGRGACGHLDGAAWAARSALAVFAEEIAAHSRHGGCGRPQGVLLPGLGEGAPDGA
ncbi:MAG TPA: NADH-ubiquinone oxidoreductase-F iron-sulfur binding region domain-containing protein [Thermomicrobiaceae bacterium]|nr:NADH-ubiquinone oxidoreductase-F iron-sulfur binding region domain-containing protein [Thermomicrobiaceae bacterium]